MKLVEHICIDCGKTRYTRSYNKSDRCFSCASIIKNKNRGQSVESRKKISLSLLGKCGKESRNYQSKDSYSKEYKLRKQREWYKNNPEKAKKISQARMARKRAGGPLSVKIVQRVYEDNIKEYGTLTCIYCLNPIEFGKDSLEHKLALANGGTNDYSNLGIACIHCNCSKRHSKKFRPKRRIA